MELQAPRELDDLFVGRVEERRDLSAWLGKRRAQGRAIKLLEGLGGVGKSNLAWAWVTVDVLGRPPGTRRPIDPAGPVSCPVDNVFFWSFQEESLFDSFLERFAASFLPGVAREAWPTEALARLERDSFLIVWDGAESLLREYAQEAGDRARDCVDRRVEHFLRRVLQSSRTALLLVSRIPFACLDRQAGVERSESGLGGLATPDAVAFLQALRVVGSEAELAAAAERYGNHPLYLSSLAAALRDDFAADGDIRGAPEHDVTETLERRQEHILARAFERRTAGARTLLTRLAAARHALVRGAVAELAWDLPAADLGKHVSELTSHNLVRAEGGRLALHPIVRAFAYKRLEQREEVHRRVAETLLESPRPKNVHVSDRLTYVLTQVFASREAGGEVIGPRLKAWLTRPVAGATAEREQRLEWAEAAWHLLHGSREDEVLAILAMPSPEHALCDALAHEGAYRIVTEILQPLCSERASKPGLALAFETLANTQTKLGKLSQAIALRRALAETRPPPDLNVLETALTNLSHNLIVSGELRLAEQTAREVITSGASSQNEFYALKNQHLVSVLVGRRRRSEALLKHAQQLVKGLVSSPELETALREQVLPFVQFVGHMARERFSEALACIEVREKAPKSVANAIEIIILKAQAQIALQQVPAALSGANNALTKCRVHGLVELETQAAHVLGAAHRAAGDPAAALNTWAAAAALAQRYELARWEAELRADLAVLLNETGRAAEARAEAERAVALSSKSGDDNYILKIPHAKATQVLARAPSLR